MLVSIIIPTKDRGEVFTKTLESAIALIGNSDSEIIVVNDSKISVPQIPGDLDIIRVINNPKSGVASARNLGASFANGSLLVFMDDDFIIPSNSLHKIIEDSSTDPNKIHLYNWIYPPDTSHTLLKTQFGRYLSYYGFTSVKGWLGNEWQEEKDFFQLKDGASYFLPIEKSLFLSIGGYNENFPHAGAEDYDFIQRAKKAGIQFYLDKKLTLYHNELDRLDYLNWLNRKKRNAETIRFAVSIGYQELRVSYSGLKSFVLSLGWIFRYCLISLEKVVPNVVALDSMYFRITNVLLAIYLFRGYSQGGKK